MDSPSPSRSAHGDSGIPAAGIGSPSSRNFNSVANVSPPPAESPEIAICPGSRPISSRARYAAALSWTAAGWGCSGASR